MAFEVRLLGSVEALVDGHSLALGGSKQRSVVALLALHANTTLSADELIDALWGDDPPQSAAKNIQQHVSRLRKALGEGRAEAEILTRGRGYELRVASGAVDALRFEQLVDEAAREPAGAGANGLAGAALELWRGAPLADVASEPFAGPEIGRLEELHLRALELVIDADLAAGRHAEAIARLEALIAAEPLRERLHEQYMLALYRDGRQSEALDAYREARETLIEQIGVEPGPELQRIQAEILDHDPSLDAPAPIVELPVQLEGGSPLLAGRERELHWLRTRWGQAREGRVVCVMVWGPSGIGKTRLVAELAAEVQREGAAVLYTGGGELAEGALATVAAAGVGHRPTLLVLDYAGDAPPSVLEATAALAREPEGGALMVCILHHDEQGPPAFAALLEAGAAQRMRLDPLREDAAAEIAALYASEGVVIPVRTLLAESEGVPLRIHRAAGGWAREEVAERLAATAGRAADDRSELSATQAAVAGGVVDLQNASERTRLYAVAEPPDPSEPAVCPFRGLAPFDAAHAEYFFGRERLVAELVARLVGSTLLAVVGPSGSGKSSAVRAGLLPALADGVVPGSESWRRAVMRPGEHPLAELSRALARAVPEAGGEDPAPWIADALDQLEPGERLVLLIDQFEEAFVACRDRAERTAFFDALVEGAGDPDERLVVVLAIRGDFYARCAEHAELSTLVSANQVLVGPLRRDELRRAIELPARRVGLRIEPGLVSALVGDVASESGGLPLLSAALVELWQRRDGRTLRRRVYEQSGGVKGAVARLAEDAYQRLSDAERLRARAILLRLAGAEEEAAAFVRRRVSLDELELERDGDAARALAVLTEARLVTVDEGAVEVAHEALLSEWPRLRGWLEADADGRRLHQHLIHAAGEWRGSGRDHAELYRGARLAAALEWASEHDPELNELERSFLDESRAASERQAERQRRAVRRLRTLLAGVGVLLAAAIVAGVIALSERHGARSAATTADARRLASQALSEERRDQALRLAGAAIALDDSPETRSGLLSALVRDSPALGVLNAPDQINSGAVLSPDGATLAVGDQSGRVTLFDTETRQRVGEYQPGHCACNVTWLGFDPRGGSLAIISSDFKTGHLDVIDAATQRLRSSARLGGYPADPGKPYLPYGAYAPDGRSVIVQYARLSGPAADAHVFLRRFDPRSGSPIGPAVRVAPRWNQEYPAWPSMTEDGRLLIAEDGVKMAATYAIDADTLRVVRRYPVGAYSQSVSPNGDTLALGETDGRVRLLDLASGRVRTLTGRHTGAVNVEGFSPDGRMLATGDTSAAEVFVWDVREGRAIETFEGHKESYDITGVAFSPDARTLYTASADTTARIWDVAGYRRLARPFRTNSVNDTGERSPSAFALSPDGHTLAAARRDGRVELIDAETLRRTGGFEAFPGRSALAIEYSPDGRRLAVAGGGGGVGLWDAGSGKRVGPLLHAPVGPARSNPHDVRALAFGRGGLLAAAGVGVGTEEGVVRIWDHEGRMPIGRPLHLPPHVRGLAFSPDGARLAIAFGLQGFDPGGSDGVKVLDVRSDETLATLRGDEVSSVAFSPDGSLLAGGELDGNVLLWATDGWERVGAPPVSGGEFPSVAFSPDGGTLATSDDEGAVALWDVESQQPIGTPLPGLPKTRTTARFTPDGDRLFAVSATGRAIRWEVDPEVWLQQACALAGSDLSPEQWEEVVPEQDYVSVCPSP